MAAAKWRPSSDLGATQQRPSGNFLSLGHWQIIAGSPACIPVEIMRSPLSRLCFLNQNFPMETHRTSHGVPKDSRRTPAGRPAISKNGWRPVNRQANSNSKLNSMGHQPGSKRGVLNLTRLLQEFRRFEHMWLGKSLAVSHGSIFMN